MRINSLSLLLAIIVTLSTSIFASQSNVLVMAERWFEKETQLEPDQYRIIAPDRSFNEYSCQQEVQFAFPFKNNQRTIEVSCENPQWKRFLTVKEKATELHPVLISAKPTGSIIGKSDIEFRPLNTDDLVTKPLSINQIIGKRLLKPRNAGDPLISADLEPILQTFQTKKAYVAGDLIKKNDVIPVQLGAVESDNLLIDWPTDVLIARQTINAGQTIQVTDVDIADFVLVATTLLRPGALTTNSNIEIRAKPLDEIPKTFLSNENQVDGLQTTRIINKGEILRQADLTVATYIKKGDPVILTIERGALKVTVDTLALEDGKLGDTVQLQNTESGKLMKGIVSGRFKANSISQ